MTEPKHIPTFSSQQEREKWFIDNADYFTVIQFRGVGKYDRHELKTKDQAMEAAKLLAETKGGKWMVYSIVGESSVYVTTVG